MPALFIGHGSPMNALEDNAFTRGWQDAARRMPRPRAIVCVSAHWETRGVYAGGTAAPETIHDFYGFPKALFDVRYPAPGNPALAQQIAQTVKGAKVHIDPGRGIDHGVWSVLRIMYPQADVPVLQLSLDNARPGDFHHALGRELAPLRADGVLIMGSGNIVHNLRLFDFHASAPADWAARADATLRARIESGDHASLIDWAGLGPEVALGVPKPEHYLPLLYVMALRSDGEPINFFNARVLSALSMTCVQIG
ncbi:MAG: 4,5-DOPA dioxygenase extradiol [Xanthomonadaceae bacterium]|nr:4,5-DOPA dioxygenase extradiol [Xanthomonadaceae bacterium]